MRPSLAIALLSARVLAAQGPPPDPDIFLASLIRTGDKVAVGAPVNITARAGYDNQPSFSPDGTSIFYTSVRADRQADIYRYDLDSRRTTRVTATVPESEYSAAVIPGTQDLAVIRVERDSTQRLWRFSLAESGRSGAMGNVLLEHVKPAGYFAFTDAQTIALFVLGSPNSLQLGSPATGRADTIVVNIGRSIHRIPGRDAFSFVSKAYENNWWIMSLDPVRRQTLPLARLPDGVEDYAWLPDGRIVAGNGSKLLLCNPATDAQWHEVADLATSGVAGITRLSVSPAGEWIAIVGVPGGR